nr:ribonuclease H-like domain-containing protein [Tanacetum cinerariifolium]
MDGEDIDWSRHVEEDTQNFTMMAYSSSNSGSDNETSADESDSKPVEYASSDFDSSVETTTSMPAPVEDAPKVVSEPKVWTDAPIIKEENVKETGTPNHYPKIEKQDKDSHTRKGLGYARKSCFDCGSFSHLIRNYDFHETRIAKQAAFTKSKEKERKATQGLLFSWAYFLKSKDETTLILKDFIRQAENQFNHKVKTIRSDNGTKFKNHNLIEFCRLKGIKREYSNARTLQQNGVAERKNMTLIEAARTMLADSFLPTTFWAEAVNTACYDLNRVLVTKPQNKRPYELLTGRQSIISYLRPFGCHVTILNTIDQSGKFDGKYDSGFLVGYSLNSKAFRMFNLDYLTNSMNYEPVLLENQANKSSVLQEANNSAGTQANDDQGANSEEIDLHDEHFVLPIWSAYSTYVKSSGDKIGKNENPVSQVEQIFHKELEKLKRQEKEANDAARKEATHETQNVNTNNTNLLNVVSTPVSAIGPLKALNDVKPSYPDDPSMPHLEDILPVQVKGFLLVHPMMMRCGH